MGEFVLNCLCGFSFALVLCWGVYMNTQVCINTLGKVTFLT